MDTHRNNRLRQIGATIGLIAIGLAACNASAQTSSKAQRPTDMVGDQLSPGFFALPSGVVAVGPKGVSRFRGARASYAWKIHNGKRELVAFSSPIQHVVVIIMENRTPENLFGAYYNTVNPATGNHFGADLGVMNPALASPSINPTPLNAAENPNHEHEPGFVNKANGVYTNLGGRIYVPTPAPGSTGATVQNYLTIIEDWAYARHVLQSNEGPSFEAHQYAIAGQTGGIPSPPTNLTPYGMVNNPGQLATASPSPTPIIGAGPDVGNGTCFSSVPPSPDTSLDIQTTDMTTPYPGNQATAPVATPCNEYPTILDFMASAAPSTPPYDQWQYVAKDTSSIWSAPMAVQHLYAEYIDTILPPKLQPFAVDPDAENFVLNVSGSTSPTPNPSRPFALLTFLTPCLRESDHPNSNGHPPDNFGSDNGPQWLAYVLNAIGTSSYWNNTAIIVTWDDWGGFYDNYQPTPWPYHPTASPNAYHNPQDPNEWGFRVPLMVISPWVKHAGYISTPLRSQGAILNFIESTFDLPTHALNADDLNNGSDDLSDMFDFTKATPMPYATTSSSFTPANDGACPPAPTPAP